MKSLIGTSAPESLSSTSSLTAANSATATGNNTQPTAMSPASRVHKKLVLFIVAVALLLDGMLNMVILPLVPEFIKYFKASGTSNQLSDLFHLKNETTNR